MNLRFNRLVIPSAITLAAIFAGYLSILASISGYYKESAALILVAALLDMIDGRVARMINASSDFGVQIDSLADVVNYGLAPALLFYALFFEQLGVVGVAVSFLPVACAAIRLARYNVTADPDIPSAYFEGLPTTMAAFVMAAWVIFAGTYYPEFGTPAQAALVTIILSLLMISTVHYDKANIFSLRYIRKTRRLLTLMAIAVSIAVSPPLALFLWGWLYITYGLTRSAIIFIWYARRDDDREAETIL
jgi:CDP-diacylglycerol--serine O-phosphatidyltransferase